MQLMEWCVWGGHKRKTKFSSNLCALVNSFKMNDERNENSKINYNNNVLSGNVRRCFIYND